MPKIRRKKMKIEPEAIAYIKSEIKLRGESVDTAYTQSSCSACAHEIKIGNDFIFCPYCGKKIAYVDYVTPFENTTAEDLFAN